MLNSTVLEVIIGLVFMYLIFSLLATNVNEIVFTFFKFRAKHLKDAIKSMLDNNTETGKELFGKVHNHPLIQSYVKKKGKGFPSYIDPKKFAHVIADIYAEEKITKTTESVKETISKLPQHNYLRKLLLTHIEKGEDKAEELQQNVEDWFNSVMERTSGWYIRNVKRWTLLFAFIIAFVFNFDSISVYKSLSRDSKVRKNMVSYVQDNIERYEEYVNADTTKTEGDDNIVAELDSLKNEIHIIIKEEISSIEQVAGIGWKDGEMKQFFTTWKIFWPKILGIIITALAISLGAPFWFDLLNKIMKLRGTGKQEKVPGTN